MEMKNKKGQIGNLQGIMLTLVVVGILIGVLFLVLAEFTGIGSDTVNTIVNESVTPTDAGVYLIYNRTTDNATCFNSLDVLVAVNQSAGFVIQPANYSWDPDTGRFWNVSGDISFNRGWNVTYTYQTGGEGCEGIESTIEASQTIPSFLPILVIVAILAILLAIIFGVIPLRGTNQT